MKVKAIYESRVLRPLEELNLKEGEEMVIVVDDFEDLIRRRKSLR